MESPLPEKEKCPSFETLSAVFDRECSEETVLHHVRKCECCQKHLSDLEELERILKLALEHETPADISERILAGVHSREKAFNRKFTVRPRILVLARVAALVAVLGLVGYVIWDDVSSSGKPVSLPPRIARTASVPSELGMPKTADLRNSGEIDAADLSTVSFSNTPEPAVYPTGAPAEELSVPIPGKVAQVWSVPAKSTGFRKEIQALIQTLGIAQAAVQTSQTEKGFSVHFRGTKLQAVQFVKVCKSLGYSLLSPVQPQPEQNRFAGKADDAIEYSAEFIRR